MESQMDTGNFKTPLVVLSQTFWDGVTLDRAISKTNWWFHSVVGGYIEVILEGILNLLLRYSHLNIIEKLNLKFQLAVYINAMHID